jgi:hypothetical protein
MARFADTVLELRLIERIADRMLIELSSQDQAQRKQIASKLARVYCPQCWGDNSECQCRRKS